MPRHQLLRLGLKIAWAYTAQGGTCQQGPFGTTSGTMSKRRPAVKSSPCLETAPQDPGHMRVSNYRHYILHIRDSKQARSAQCNLLGSTLELQGHQQVFFSSTSRSAGQQAGTSRVTSMGGSAQTMSGLEDRLSCMWNDVWNDVKTTSSCEEPAALLGQQLQALCMAHSRKQASKHAQHSAICWAARWNARATDRSLFSSTSRSAG